MKNDLEKYIKKLLPVAGFIQKYSRFLFFLLLAGICGFLIFRINSLAGVTPSESDITDRLQTVTRPRIDESALQKIQELQDQNVQVQSLIQDARDNPFSE